jgi:hypothetical protein
MEKNKKYEVHINYKNSSGIINIHDKVFIRVEMKLTDMRYGLRGPWKWFNEVQWQTRAGTAQSVQ